MTANANCTHLLLGDMWVRIFLATVVDILPSQWWENEKNVYYLAFLNIYIDTTN
jgi:hypothetical protein